MLNQTTSNTQGSTPLVNPASTSIPKLKFIDLFCGVGGFHIALQRRGFECVFASDINTHAQLAYEKNFGIQPHGDITEIHASKIPAHDILCGGFPCQPFSISGNHGGTADPRGQLFNEIIRIAAYHQPKILLLENVKNILSISGGEVLKTIGQKLNDIGYDLNYCSLNASHFGIPQARERVYFVALRKDLGLTWVAPTPCKEKIYLASILDSEVDNAVILNRNDIKLSKSDNDVDYSLKPVRLGVVGNGGQGERIYSIKGHAVTQLASGGGVGAKTGLYLTPQGVRRLTINESKRVMGFDSSHYVSQGTQGYQQLGNAVIPAMIGHIFDGIKEM